MGQIFTVGKGDGVHEHVYAAPFFLDEGRRCGNLLVTGHIAGKGEITTEFFGNRKDTFMYCLSRIAESELCSLFFEFAGDAVGNALGIGDSKMRHFLFCNSMSSSLPVRVLKSQVCW